MNPREEQEQALHPYSQGELESPFLEDEFFAEEPEDEGEAHLAALEAESAFLHAFEGTSSPAIEPALYTETFGEEGEENEADTFFADEDLEVEWDISPEELFEARMESEVFGSNDMDAVANTLAIPYRWICRLDIEYEITPWNSTRKLAGRGRGSGTLIGPCHVLTAAHNITSYDPVGRNYLRATRIRVTAAHNGSGSPPVATVDVDMSNLHVHPRWRLSQRVSSGGSPNPAGEVVTNRYDYALLRLKSPIGQSSVRALGAPLGYWSRQGSGGTAYFERLEPNVLGSHVVSVTGHGDDTCVVAVRSARSKPAIPLGSQLTASGQITLVWEGTQRRYVGRSMVHAVDTCGGQSGAPVWLQRDGKYYLVGVHTGGVGLTSGSRANHAVRVTGEMIQQVNDWVARSPCPTVPGETEREENLEGEALYLNEEVEDNEGDELEAFGWEGEGVQSEFETLYEDETLEVMEDGTVDREALLGEDFNGTRHLKSIAGEEVLEDPYPDIGELPLVERNVEDGERLSRRTTHFAEEEPLVPDEGQFGELAWEESEAFVEGELTTASINEAIRLNSQYAKRLGWERYRDRIEIFLKTSKFWDTSMWPDRDFPKAVARWQEKHGLKSDGIIGPVSWNRLKVMICVGYEAGEVAKSRTQSGHLEQDVFMTKGGWLMVADFAIGQKEIKASTRKERLLKEWIEKFEAATPDEILIIGFSDCVGEENNNEALRRSRAVEVAKLFGPKARAKARIFSGKMGRYVADGNRTSTSRAINRGVLIQWKREIKFSPDKVSGDPSKLMATVLRCAVLVSADISGKAGERIRKMVGIANRIGYPRNLQLWYYNPQPMVRYFNWRTDNKTRAVMTSDTGGRMPFDGYAHPEHWRVNPFQTMAARYGTTDTGPCAPEIRQYLLVMHDQIEMSFANIQRQIDSTALGGGTLHKGAPEAFLKHLHELRGTPDHLYSAFK